MSKQAKGALDDPDEGKDGEDEGRPVNESTGGLVSEDRPQRPSDRDAGGKVTLGSGERVCGGGTLKEEECEEDEDLGPDTGAVGERVSSECLKGGENDEDGGPTVVEGEGEVDENFITKRLRRMMLLYDIIDVRDSAADEEGSNESKNVMTAGPEIDIDGVENAEERKAPRNAVDDDAFALRSKLVDDGSQKKCVNNGPDEERPRRRCDVGLFSRVVDTRGRSDGVQVRPEEEHVR